MTSRVWLLVLALAATTGCAGRIATFDTDSEPIPSPRLTAPPIPVPLVGRDRLLAFIRWRNRRLDPAIAGRIAEGLERHAGDMNLDARLVACVVAVESSFDPRARSSTGAMGLGQLLPSTAKDLGVSDPHDIEQNLRGTAAYLAWLLVQWEGRQELAIASYSAGVGTVKRQVKDGKPLTPQQNLYVQRVLGLYPKI